MRPRFWIMSIALLAMVASSGCRNFCRRDQPRPNYGPPRGYNIPQQNIPDLPPPPGSGIGSAPAPMGPSGNGNTELLLPQAPPRSNYPPADFNTYETPKALPKAAPKASPEAPRARIDEDSKSIGANPPLPKEEPAKEPSPMVKSASGIPGFGTIKEGVFGGLRPEITGLDWLKENGYKTIVYLHAPSEDETTDRREVERRGMKFVSVPLKPETLDEKWMDDFNNLIRKTDEQPMFIYDKDGTMSGAVWYVHFRTAEFLTHDEAKLRANRLGLKAGTPMHDAALKFVGVRP
jgi:protein tyrosine phosphatase (PTP) superfamily phosphohydrolase (DUF442 family)